MVNGAITAMITPMFDGGNIDYKGFINQLYYQLKNDIRGVVVLGTTGEAPQIEKNERKKLIKLAVKKFKSPDKRFVFVGTTSENYKETIENTIQARELNADAALVSVTPYIKPPTSGLVNYFLKVADIMPTIVYDIPSRTGRAIQLDEFQKIAEHPNIVGVKAASGDIDQIASLIQNVAMPLRRDGRDFYVWSGDDAMTVRVCEAGGNGVISVVSNLLPSSVQSMARGDTKWANAVADKLAPAMKAAFTENNPVAIKYMMWYAGMIGSNEVRPTLGQLLPESKAFVESVVKKYFKNVRQ
ncbi:MAG: 4-hydroxy-tetrahydrodipicolinate synthase [Rickettsiales bacterium]|jgi:4-hydroxy-tetrahydrodipicolinate synthase|nr:4-hydroxy-tetrahydrodipicolinate synthase [Rickettsiales bacterium]